MSGSVAVFRSRAAAAAVLCAVLAAGCGGGEGGPKVSVGDPGDGDGSAAEPERESTCDAIEIDGDVVTEHEANFTARYRIGQRYTKTVMLFGGEAIAAEDTLGNAYVLGLDKSDAMMLAQEYPDFHLCSSPGGDAAAAHVFPYDFVPASCDVYERLIAALDQFRLNHRAGGDRTSIRFEGAPLELIDVVQNDNGADVTDQVTTADFHLITSVEQLTGQSVLEFGTTD